MRLEVQELGFGYPGKAVGRDVTFKVDPGEVVVLLGPNGCGKTTLFKTILNLLPRQAGDVSVDGRSTRSFTRNELARAIAYVPQAYAGYFPFTLLDTVLMGRTAHIALFASPTKSDRAQAAHMLEFMGIGHLREEPYTAVSGGQRQLALIARALVQEARILVMDEPTASLDFGNQVKVLDVIRSLAAEGMGIILSTHDPDHAFLCGHRVAMMKDGRLYRIGSAEEVITSQSLRHVYGVDIEVRAIDVVTPKGTRQIRVCLPTEIAAQAAARVH